MLWGKFAQEKRILIDETKHLILKRSSFSPFSACRVFLDANIFQKQMTYLNEQGN